MGANIFQPRWTFFLGGKSTECFEEFFKIWWTGYKKMDPNLPFFNDFGEKFVRASLPIALHGDEGHGRYKRPIMIFSYQPLITSFDGRVNLKGSGCVQQSVWISIHLNYILSCLYPKIFWVEICMFPHSFQKHVNFLMFPLRTPGRTTYCNRLLYAVLPPSMYAKKDKSIDALVTALVRDFNELYWDGFDAPCPIGWPIPLPQKPLIFLSGVYILIYFNPTLTLSQIPSRPIMLSGEHRRKCCEAEACFLWVEGWLALSQEDPQLLGSVITVLALNLW